MESYISKLSNSKIATDYIRVYFKPHLSKNQHQKYKLHIWIVQDTNIKKGQPGALKLPHMQGPGRGPTIWCIVRSLTLFLHKRLFPGLEPVTLRSHDNNFTSCAKVTPRAVHEYVEHKTYHIDSIWRQMELALSNLASFDTSHAPCLVAFETSEYTSRVGAHMENWNR
jgi:hypothetical protein